LVSRLPPPCAVAASIGKSVDNCLDSGDHGATRTFRNDHQGRDCAEARLLPPRSRTLCS
jgi:hypothetical protein